MATKYEYYITGADHHYGIWGVSWYAQTFTPSIPHIITSVKLLVSKYSTGNPGNATIAIRATDGDGKPTGSNLCSGTLDVDSLTSDDAGEWVEITLGTGTLLIDNAKYAIVVSCPGGDGSTKFLWWRDDITSASYTGGTEYNSSDSGSSWVVIDPDYDFMFEEWGDPEGSNGGGSIFPSDDVARVSSIRHIFRPGFFRMQVGLGDLGFDIDVAEVTVRRELDTAKGPPLPTRWPPAPGEEPGPITCPICGETVPYFEFATHLRTAHPSPARFPTYEAQIEYEEWFQRMMEELRKLGWEG